jgi:hypothetical protein
MTLKSILKNCNLQWNPQLPYRQTADLPMPTLDYDADEAELQRQTMKKNGGGCGCAVRQYDRTYVRCESFPNSDYKTSETGLLTRQTHSSYAKKTE